eukprot:8555143-Pyramimonas_sp.AAC.1
MIEYRVQLNTLSSTKQYATTRVPRHGDRPGTEPVGLVQLDCRVPPDVSPTTFILPPIVRVLRGFQPGHLRPPPVPLLRRTRPRTIGGRIEFSCGAAAQQGLHGHPSVQSLSLGNADTGNQAIALNIHTIALNVHTIARNVHTIALNVHTNALNVHTFA